MDQAAMVNLYWELYARTKNNDYLEEALKFFYTWNWTYWFTKQKYDLDNQKEIWEIINSSLKLYLLTWIVDFKETIEWFIKEINYKKINDDIDKFNLAHWLIISSYFLKNEEYLKKYYELKNITDSNSILYDNLILLEELYYPWKNDINKINTNINFSNKNWINFYNIFNKLELLSLLNKNEIIEKIIKNNIDYFMNLNNNYMEIWKWLISMCNYNNWDSYDTFIKNNKEKIISNWLKDNTNKWFSYADEWDNFSPFFLSLYWKIIENKCYHRLIDKNFYENFKITNIANFNQDQYSWLTNRKIFLYLIYSYNNSNYIDLNLIITNLTNNEIKLNFISLENKYNTIFPKNIILKAWEYKSIKSKIENEKLDRSNLKFYFEDENNNKYFVDP